MTGRSAQGVTIFKVGDDENVVSVAWLVQEDDDEDEDELEGEVLPEEGDEKTESAQTQPPADEAAESDDAE